MSPAAAATTEAEAKAKSLFLARSIFFNGYAKTNYQISRKSAKPRPIAMSNEARYVAGKKLLEARKTEAAIELFQEILEEK